VDDAICVSREEKKMMMMMMTMIMMKRAEIVDISAIAADEMSKAPPFFQTPMRTRRYSYVLIPSFPFFFFSFLLLCDVRFVAFNKHIQTTVKKNS
jgi:hypothetical protein